LAGPVVGAVVERWVGAFAVDVFAGGEPGARLTGALDGGRVGEAEFCGEDPVRGGRGAERARVGAAAEPTPAPAVERAESELEGAESAADVSELPADVGESVAPDAESPGSVAESVLAAESSVFARESPELAGPGARARAVELEGRACSAVSLRAVLASFARSATPFARCSAAPAEVRSP
jgi:hypothetical protein